MKNILTILIALTFVACNHSTKNNKSISTSIDTIKSVSVDINKVENYSDSSNNKETEIVVKNKTDYSEKFIKELKGLGYKKIELIDSLLILDKKDTITFS